MAMEEVHFVVKAFSIKLGDDFLAHDVINMLDVDNHSSFDVSRTGDGYVEHVIVAMAGVSGYRIGVKVALGSGLWALGMWMLDAEA